MLYYYRKHFHDIFVFSPTVLSDDKWDWIKSQKHILAENKPLKKWIKEEQRRRQGAFKNQIVQDPPLSLDLDINTNEQVFFKGFFFLILKFFKGRIRWENPRRQFFSSLH